MILKIDLNKDATVMEQLQKAGVEVNSDCGGRAMCGKCRVRFVEGAPEPTKAEKNIIAKGRLDAGWRLACCCYYCGEAELEIPESKF